MNDAGLSALFAPFGTVDSAQVIMGRDAGRPRALGSSKWPRRRKAGAAIARLNGQRKTAGAPSRSTEAKPVKGELPAARRRRWPAVLNNSFND